MSGSLSHGMMEHYKALDSVGYEGIISEQVC